MKLTNFFFLIICFWSCTNPETKSNDKVFNDTLRKINQDTTKISFIRLDKLNLSGDFDGDGKMDLLTQSIISKLNNSTIDSFPDNIEWDKQWRFFDSIQSDVILTLENPKYDTLHFLNAKGLYCLINIGDINFDKKDEIALVVEHCDFSRINSCHIFTLCSNKFVELTSFNINEGSFDYSGDIEPDFKEIKGSLEKRRGKWVYIDYYKWFDALESTDTFLRPLKFKKGC